MGTFSDIAEEIIRNEKNRATRAAKYVESLSQNQPPGAPTLVAQSRRVIIVAEENPRLTAPLESWVAKVEKVLEFYMANELLLPLPPWDIVPGEGVAQGQGRNSRSPGDGADTKDYLSESARQSLVESLLSELEESLRVEQVPDSEIEAILEEERANLVSIYNVQAL